MAFRFPILLNGHFYGVYIRFWLLISAVIWTVKEAPVIKIYIERAGGLLFLRVNVMHSFCLGSLSTLAFFVNKL